jgi:hypothetical protein
MDSIIEKFVRIRFRKQTESKPTWLFVGKVFSFGEAWIGVKGKGILLYSRKTTFSDASTLRGADMIRTNAASGNSLPYEVDEESRQLLFPRDGILSVRILPDNFDVENIKIKFSGKRIDLHVDGAPDSALDELYED